MQYVNNMFSFDDSVLVIIQAAIAILLFVVNIVLAGFYYQDYQDNRTNFVADNRKEVISIVLYICAYAVAVIVLSVSTVQIPPEWEVINIVFLACHFVVTLVNASNEPDASNKRVELMKWVQIISLLGVFLCTAAWGLLIFINTLHSEVWQQVVVALCIVYMLIRNIYVLKVLLVDK